LKNWPFFPFLRQQKRPFLFPLEALFAAPSFFSFLEVLVSPHFPEKFFPFFSGSTAPPFFFFEACRGGGDSLFGEWPFPPLCSGGRPACFLNPTLLFSFPSATVSFPSLSEAVAVPSGIPKPPRSDRSAFFFPF